MTEWVCLHSSDDGKSYKFFTDKDIAVSSVDPETGRILLKPHREARHAHWVAFIRYLGLPMYSCYNFSVEEFADKVLARFPGPLLMEEQ